MRSNMCNEALGRIRKNHMHNRNRKLEIYTAPTKARSREPAYSQALVQNKNVACIGLMYMYIAIWCNF